MSDNIWRTRYEKLSMKIVILGSSRGLGKELFLKLRAVHAHASFLLVSRKIHLLETHQSEFVEIFQADFTKDVTELFEKIKEFAPTHIICNAGGGVHGNYLNKNWKDHLWTLQLNLIFPMSLAHFCWNQIETLQQLIFIGSSVAESGPDPEASSYCASKHGLKGFVESLQIENPEADMRLMSPPYMETDLLPPGSWPRRKGLAIPPDAVAEKIVFHMMDKLAKNTHIVL